LTRHRSVNTIEADIAAAERRLFSIKDEIAGWEDASASLTASAAIERAKNGEMGRGLGGALFGAKYRAAARRTAASSNAAIARDVANKRATITRAKQDLRTAERQLRAALRDLKAELKDSRSFAQEQARIARRAVPAPAPAPPPPPPPGPVDLKQELQRLKALYQQGQLDAVAYEKARIELLQPHLRP
jgi:flagellar motility protein MotE (MotC chaperone)